MQANLTLTPSKVIPDVPSNVRYVGGNILNSTCEVIAHQCNCMNTIPSGLTKDIFTVFPHADTYKKRVRYNIPGTIDLMGSESQRYVINMYAQYNQGSLRETLVKQGSLKETLVKQGSLKETSQIREAWFAECLSKIRGIKSIAFPYGIGCEYGGGRWDNYHNMILTFARQNPRIEVHIVKSERIN